MKTPLSSILMVFGAAFVGSFGSVFLKAGSGKLKADLKALLLNWQLLAGVVMFLGSSLLFIAAIRQGELTILYPMVSLSYVFTLVWSRLFFKEPFTRNKILGLALIFVGIVFLSLGRA